MGAPAATSTYVETQHENFVHDAQLDYYGAKLATCSSGESSGQRIGEEHESAVYISRKLPPPFRFILFV